MKTRRFIAGLSALALAAAMAPMAAFSDTPNIKDNPSTGLGELVSGTTNSNTDVTQITEKSPKTDDKQLGSTTATFTVNPTYTVTIPSAAPIGDDANSAVPQLIEAKNVVLEEGQKIIVTLSGASNTTAGSVFNAMTGKLGDMNRSTVKYKIKKTDDKEGTDIALNGTVAEFTGNQSVQLKFIKDNSEDNKPTAAGAHTEQLTFSIALEGAEKTLTIDNVTIKYSDGDTWAKIAEKNDGVEIDTVFVIISNRVLCLGPEIVSPGEVIKPDGDYNLTLI